MSVGLNFPLLDEYFSRREGCTWVVPLKEKSDIYSRMLGANVAPATVEQFNSSFDKSHYDWKREPANAANGCVQAGRYEAAAIAYREALERQPYNWLLMSEAAKFLMITLRDGNAGLELVRTALTLNPCSPELWNTMGDGLFLLDRVGEAQQSYLRAIKLDPEDVRARYNLSFVFEHDKDYAGALRIIGEALSLDRRGAYREGLLRKQSEVLEKLASRTHQQGQRMVNRVTDITGPPQISTPGAQK